MGKTAALSADKKQEIMMREIVVDTETTGLNPSQGHKMVEIGCVELLRCVPTGKEFHRYLNPQRDIPESAREIHGIDEAFVKNKPRFADIADEMLEFFGDARLVIHNAPFDLGFLDAELTLCGKPTLSNPVQDTLVLAQDRFRGERVGLDALCRRYGIDLSMRQRHGALIDAHLLAKVYLELCGGRQQGIGFDAVEPLPPSSAHEVQGIVTAQEKTEAQGEEQGEEKEEHAPFRVLQASAEEQAAHRALLEEIEKNRDRSAS